MRKILLILTALVMSVAVFAQKITTSGGITSGNKYYIGATTNSTDYYFYVDGSSATESIKGTAKEDKADAVALTFTAVTGGWTIQFDNGLYLGLKNAKDNGAVQVMESPVVWTIEEDADNGLLKLHPNDNYYLQKNNSGTQFGSYNNTHTNVWLESAGSAPVSAILESIVIKGAATKMAYEVGEAFDPAGLEVWGLYTKYVKNDSTSQITSGITWSINPETFTTVSGNASVTLSASYKDKTSSDTTITGINVSNPPFVENFDNMADFADGYYVKNATINTTASYSYGNAGKSVKLTTTATDGAYIIFPLMNIAANNIEVDFMMRRAAAATATIKAIPFQVGYLTDPTDVTTFIPAIQDVIDGDASWRNIRLNTARIQDVTTPVMVCINIGAAYATSVYLDEVSIHVMPSCTRPEHLTASAVKADHVTLTWDMSNASSFVVKALQLPDSVVTTYPATQSPFTVTGLIPQTTYEFTVQGVCSATDSSEVTRPISVRTECAAADSPIFFEGAEGTTGTAIPECWKTDYIVNMSTSTAAPFQTSTTTKIGTRAFSIPYKATGTISYLCSQPLHFDQSGKYSFRYQMYRPSGTSYNGETLTIYVTPSVGDTANAVEVIPAINFSAGNAPIGTTGWNEYEGVINYQGDGYIMAVINCKNGMQRYIDNLEVFLTPSCPKPNEVAITNITTHSFDISFVDNASASQWVVYTNGTPNVITTNPATISNLDASMNYTVSIAAVCSATDTSAVTDCGTIRTLCNKLSTPWVCGFEASEGYVGGTSYNAETTADFNVGCWTIFNQKPGGATYPYAYVSTSSTYVHSGVQGVYTNTNSSATKNLYMMLPDLSDPSNKLRINVWYKNGGTNTAYSDLEFGYFTDPTADTSFVTVYTFPKSSTWIKGEILTNNASYNIPANARIGFMIDRNSTGNGLYLDDISVNLIRNCSDPDAPTVSDITAASAKVTFTDTCATHTAWEYVYGPMGFDPNTATPVSIDTTAFTLTGLTDDSNYNVYVRAVCGVGDVSNYVPVSFKTLCLPFHVTATTPFFEDFNNYNYGAYLNNGTCYTILGEDLSASNSYWAMVYPTSEPSATATTFYFYGHSADRYDRSLYWNFYKTYITNGTFLRQFHLDAGTTYEMSAWARNSTTTSYSTLLSAMMGTTANDLDTLASLVLDGATTTSRVIEGHTTYPYNELYQEIKAFITPDSTGDYYIGFNAAINNTKSYSYLYFDDWSIRAVGAPAHPLCFTAEAANSTIELKKSGSPTGVTIQYQVNGTAADGWTSVDFSTATTTEQISLANVGDKVYFRNASNEVTEFSTDGWNYYQFAMTGSIAASGNVMSLVDKSCQTLTIPCNFCFTKLFQGCSSLTTAPELPATTLTDNCYQYMFSRCSSLTAAPELPATIMATRCYQYMFEYCTSLTTAPALPATTLADTCYSNMFSNCTTLTAAPALPATTLADYCYGYMFSKCSSLTTAPALPATTLAANCYSQMFNSCDSLTTAPALPATTLANNCYQSMFTLCSSLTAAPALPATTLTNNCYQNMFAGCYSLTTAPALPATTLAANCYQNMFSNCTTLTVAPALPATTLANNCYNGMFQACTSLTAAPVLPATTLTDKCYQNMFKGCSSLVVNTTAPGVEWSIPAGATVASNATSNMFQNTGGDFTGAPAPGTTYYIASATIPVSYLAPVYNTVGDPTSGIARWDTLQCTSYNVVSDTTTTLNAGWYVVTGIDVQTGMLTCNGAVHLILADGAKLTATAQSEGQAGIIVSGTGNSLIVYAQSTNSTQMGELTATGGDYGAGIGGGYESSGSNITINGGAVTATGGEWAAGIGGGEMGSGSNITINGGAVTATGGEYAAGIGGGEYGNGTNITINGGNVTATGGYLASGIGDGISLTSSLASNIFVSTDLVVKADGNNPPTTVIPNTGSDLTGSLNGKRYATIEPAPAVSNDLTDIINSELIGKNSGDTVVLNLSNTIDYVISQPVDLGLVNIIINGNGAKVTLADSTQIAGQQRIEINNVNFDCAANTKLAPIALSANPDSSLVGARFQTEGTSLRANAFYNAGTITLNNCNFSGVKTSLVSANKREWNLKNLTIKNCIVQFDVASGIESYINWYGNSKNEGSIKEIVIEGSTLYNIVESNENYFLRYANNSNSQPQKAWPEPQFDGKCSWTMTNNTIVNLPSNKDFANNYPNKNPICEFTWKGNIFYNTTLLRKAIQSNVANFTAADNSIWGVTKLVDATDASKFATVDSTLVFSVPETNLDLANIDLKANFAPSTTSYAGSHGFGDPRWAPTVSPNLTANLIHVKVGEKQPIAVSSYSKGAITVENLTPGLVRIENDSLVALAAGEAKLKITQAALAPFEEAVINQAKFNIVEATEKPIAETAVGIYRPLFGDDTNGYLLDTPSVKTVEGITVTPTFGTNVEYASAPVNDLYDGLKHKLMANDNVFYPSVQKDDIDGESFFGFDINIPAEKPVNIDSLDVLLAVSNAYMWRVQITNEAGDTIWRSAGEAEDKDIKANGYNQAYCYTNQFIATRDTVKLSEAAAQKLLEWSMEPNYSVATSEKLPVLRGVTGKYSVKVYYWGKSKKSLSYEKVFLHLSDGASVIVSADVNDETMGSVSGAGEYMIDEEVTLTAIPEENYHFVNWNSGSTENPLIFNAEKDTAFTANFEGDPHTITVLPSDSARGVVEGTGVYNYGDTATLVATSVYPYQFAYWEDESHTESDTLKVKVLGDSTFTAIFKLGKFDVTAAANDPAMGTVTGGGTYVYDTIVNVTAIPNEHYHFVHWNNGSVNPTTTVVVRFDTTLTATFAIDQHVVRTDVNNNTLGTVTGAGAYNYGEEVTLTATPAAHAVFTGWSNGLTDDTITITLAGDTTVTAMFAADTHTIAATADPTMGSVTGAGEYVHGTLATLTATANEHYHFVNWSNDLTANTFSILVDKDSTVTANFAIDQHVVKVNANDNALGTVAGAGTYNYGEEVTLTATPAAHAVFTGWSNGLTDDTITITLAGDTTVTAMFAADTHTIAATADPTMGSVTGAGEYVHGTLATLTATANEHYHFVNWSNGLTANTFSILVDKDSTVTANFAIDQHVVKVNANDNALGTVAGAGTYNYGASVTLTATAAAHGVFTGWSDGTTANPYTFTLAGDTTVTANFIADSHVIAANVNNAAMGTVAGAGTYTHGALATLTATANEHYHFVNWSNGLTANTFSILVDKDSTVTANFAIDQHVVKVNANDNALGTVAGAGTYNYGASVTLTATAAAHGVFTGWSNGLTDATINITVAGDTTVTAMFAADTHTIAANVNSTTMGSVTGAGEYVHGTLATLTATANEHYHFVNWSNGLTANTFSILVDKDSTVTANFAIDQHVVKVNANDNALGTVAGAGTYNYGATATLTATPADSHSVFTGWSNGATTPTINITVAGDTTVTANFTVDSHVIAANVNNAAMGTVAGAGTYAHGALATLTATPNEHFHFVNWSNGITSNSFSILVDRDSTVTANFAIDQHNVSAIVNNQVMGTVEGTGLYNYGATATLTAVPAAHYHFVRWNTGKTNVNQTVNVTGDITFIATFAIDQHNATILSSDESLGIVSGSGLYNYGSQVAINAIPNHRGVSFTGWSNGLTTPTAVIDLTKDTVITASFVLNHYDIILNVNDETMGSVAGAGTYIYGDEVTITATAADDCHSFVRWSDGETAATRTITVDDNVTLTAIFAIDQYTISVASSDNAGGVAYCDKSGAGVSSMTVACGTMVDIYAEANQYYHFVEWSDGVTDDMRSIEVNGDINLVAIFAPNCGDNADLPVVFLYNGLVMLDLDSVKERGYDPKPSQVKWYQVIDDVDDIDEAFPADDKFICEGYYLSLPTNNVGYGQYYAVVDVSNSPAALCHDKMKTVVVEYTNTNSQPNVQMAPTRVKSGEVITITGLVPDEKTTITVYDYTGKSVDVMQTEGLATYDFTSYGVTGVYIVKVTSDSVNETFKFIVSK